MCVCVCVGVCVCARVSVRMCTHKYTHTYTGFPVIKLLRTTMPYFITQSLNLCVCTHTCMYVCMYTRRRRTVISVKSGSHLMPRRFREVSCPHDWPFYLSHYPRYLDGKKTRARIPDDGCEPKTAEEAAPAWVPMRDTRFLNVTGPLQVYM